MFFNSLEYAIFLPIVFILYWVLQKKELKYQNILLLLSSYIFYICWDWRFVFLLMFSTLLDYYSGIKIENCKTKAQKKFWLILSVGLNLGFLGFFKYFNFFIDSFSELISNFGFTPHRSTLKIILPVGISFYTFHGLSYVFDIYNNKIKATKNPVDYCLFVSFFPLLVAGPIERATHLLPQIQAKRNFSYAKAVDGLRQILWGLFKKLIIADLSAIAVNHIFSNYEILPASTIILGCILFAFQIYGDFSGYSDMALGSARLLGFELLQNFRFPYFSRSIGEFWKRWHISLSSWFKDYLYIPLGGSKGSTLMIIRNTFIIFLVSGFWHGANWTFILWGGLNALFMVPSILFKNKKKMTDTIAQGRLFPSIKELISLVTTFTLTCFAWVFFRAESIGQAFSIIKKIIANPAQIFTNPISNLSYALPILPIIFFLIIEWLGRENKYGLEKTLATKHWIFRWGLYYTIILIIVLFYSDTTKNFIYFQF